MTVSRLSYALVTPARDEAENLDRLAASVTAQSILPTAWVIVDNGSTDDTPELAERLAEQHHWIGLVRVPGEIMQPGAPVVRAFNAGMAALGESPDVVVKLDADVSFDANYFEQLLVEFARDPTLGIAGGVCYEFEKGAWTPKHVTGDHVRGATRAYRLACLHDIEPLPEAMGWDGVDELKASVVGWRTASISHLRFYHHRSVGARDGGRSQRWLAEGRSAHFMGYGFTYLLVRTVGRAIRDREPAAVGMLWGFGAAMLRREPQYPDDAVRAYLRQEQSVRRLPLRLREAFGRRGG